jgi:hypothetical protein
LLKASVGAEILGEEWHPIVTKDANSTDNVAVCATMCRRDTIDLHHEGLSVKFARLSRAVPETVSADDTVVGYYEQTQMEAPLGKPEAVFHGSIPGENGVGLRFRADFFNIFNHPNFGNPNNTLNSPLFGRSTQTLASSLGTGGNAGGFNPLYQIGGPAPSSSPSSSNSDRARRYRTQSKLLMIMIDRLYQYVIIVSLNRRDSCRFCDHAFPTRGPSSFVKTISHSPFTFLQTHLSRNPFGCNTYERVRKC